MKDRGVGDAVARLYNESRTQKAVNRVGRSSSALEVSYISNAQWDMGGTMHTGQAVGSAYVSVRLEIECDGIIPICVIEYEAEFNGHRLTEDMFARRDAYSETTFGFDLGGGEWITGVRIGVADSVGQEDMDFGGIRGFQGVGNRNGPREYAFLAMYEQTDGSKLTDSWQPPQFKLKFRVLSSQKVAVKCRRND